MSVNLLHKCLPSTVAFVAWSKNKHVPDEAQQKRQTENETCEFSALVCPRLYMVSYCHTGTGH